MALLNTTDTFFHTLNYLPPNIDETILSMYYSGISDETEFQFFQVPILGTCSGSDTTYMCRFLNSDLCNGDEP